MAARTKTVKLDRPVKAFDVVYTELVLRAPNGRDFLDIGPLSQSFRSGEVESTSDMPGAVAAYLRRCITNVEDTHTALDIIVLDLTLVDTMRLRRALADFFIEAAAEMVAGDMAAAAAAKERAAQAASAAAA